MPRYTPCNPPCSNYGCYVCNAGARDLALLAKSRGQSMADLPDWVQWRVRRMAAQTAQAQATTDAYSRSREVTRAYDNASRSARDASNTWFCYDCGAEQGETIEKYVHLQRRYCPSCAIALKARLVEADAVRALEAERAAYRAREAEAERVRLIKERNAALEVQRREAAVKTGNLQGSVNASDESARWKNLDLDNTPSEVKLEERPEEKPEEEAKRFQLIEIE